MGDVPKTVRIAGHIIDVVLVPPSPLGDELDGSFEEAQQTICVAVSGPDSMRETLLHEVIHACERAGLLDMDEHQVHVLARNLYAFMRDNPAAVAWLMDR